MQALLDAGADPALTTDIRSTALMAAAGAGRVLGKNTLKHGPLLEAATLAVKAGADVNAVDDFGNTALHYAAYQILRSSTGDLLRKLGAPAIPPSYERARPRDWPDLALQ